MKIQPIDSNTPEAPRYFESVKVAPKSRFKRLFDFSSLLRPSVPDKITGGGVGEFQCVKSGSEEFEPSSVCLDKMVQNFIEGANEKQSVCGRNHCNCFNGNCNNASSDDEFDSVNCFGNSNHNSSSDACELLKSLVLCESVSERNLLADTAKIVEKNKICKRKDEFCRKIVSDGLFASGYDVSICKSRWEKSPSFPAGEYDYIDAIIGGERLIIDIDFRSEFEIARSTKGYRAILQTLPTIFVGKPERLQKIIQIVSDAAKQSLKKKGMHFPPWRKADYVKAKWLSPYTRIVPFDPNTDDSSKSNQANKELADKFEVISASGSISIEGDSVIVDDGDEVSFLAVKPLEIKRKGSFKNGGKVISGLASVIEDN